MEINNQPKDKLLIIGGTGFIGRHVVHEALKRNFKLTVISKNPVPSFLKIKNVDYIEVDIVNIQALNKSLKAISFNYVINLGGYIDHSDYLNGGNLVFDNHFFGLKNLVDCLDKSKLKSFVQIGSSDEYGNNPAPQVETQREMPFSIYSCAKLAATNFLITLNKTDKFPAIILRPFLIYGPGQDLSRFIPQVIRGCLSDESFPASSGEQLRDFCYIDDFVKALFLAIKVGPHGEIINIASGKPISVKKAVTKIVDIIGTGRPEFGQLDYRPSENMSLYADIYKAKKILGWMPSIDFETGIKKTIIWSKRNL